MTKDHAKTQGIKVKKGLFPWTATGRAIANGRDEGVTKLLFDDSPEAGSADGHGSCTDLAANAQLPIGPVLLVASTVRTRWAATMAAALLREHGAPQVLLLAMHLQP